MGGHDTSEDESHMDIIVNVFKWLVRSSKGENTDHMNLNWSSVVFAVDRLPQEELQYLYSLSNTNNTEQMLELINTSRHRQGTMGPGLDEFYEYQVSNYLNLYIPPIILVVGTLGNILSLAVLRSKPMAGVSSYSYLASLAITDTVVLYTGMLRIWLISLIGHDYHATSDWVCKLSVLFSYTASDLSVWLIIAVTVERYIVVCLPFRASSMCNVSRAKKVIVFLFVAILAINLHFLWTVTVKEDVNGPLCKAADRFVTLVDVAWPWVDAFIYSFVPFIIIIALNIIISKEVMGAQSKRWQMAATDIKSSYSSHTHHHRADDQRRQQHSNDGTRLTVMLLTVSFTFLLLTLPVNIMLIYVYFFNSNSPKEGESSDDFKRNMAHLYLIKAIIELLMYTNHSINFFLYCATGQKFRRQITGLLKRCLRCRTHAMSGFSFRRSPRRTSGSMLGLASETTTSQCNHRAGSCVSFDMAVCSLRWDCGQDTNDACFSTNKGQDVLISKTDDVASVTDLELHKTFCKDGVCDRRHTLSSKDTKNNLNRSRRDSSEINRNSNSSKICGKNNCKQFVKKGNYCVIETPVGGGKPSYKVYFSSNKRNNTSNQGRCHNLHSPSYTTGLLSAHWNTEEKNSNLNGKPMDECSV